MKIEKNKVVAVSYELKLAEKSEEVIDLAYEDSPLEFLFGSGMMLQKFEENLSNLSKDDTFEFKLTIEEGYGTRNEDYISEVPMNIFEKDGKVEFAISEERLTREKLYYGFPVLSLEYIFAGLLIPT